ncbi:MAG: heme-binding protein [Isosphaeraceae bacterium]
MVLRVGANECGAGGLASLLHRAVVMAATLVGVGGAVEAYGPGQDDGPRQEPRSLLDPRQSQGAGAVAVDPRRSPPELTTVPSDVRDQAKLFSTDAVRSARESLAKIEKSIGAPVLIETIESLEGDEIDEVAARRARRAGSQGIFVLVSRKESKLEVLPSRRYVAGLPREARTRVREAFIDGFRRREFDEGLRKGIAALEQELADARKAGRLPQAEQPDFGDELRKRGLLPAASGAVHEANGQGDRSGVRAAESPSGSLVRRDRIHLTLGGARLIIAEAARQAAAMNLKVNIAVVDDGGHLLSFDRMDDARPASGYTAITKATTAATFRQATGPLPAGTANPDPLLNPSVQLAAQASGGKVTTLFGGVPIVVDGQVIGGVGVGGGSGEQDATIARSGIQAFLQRLTDPAVQKDDRTK